VLATTPDLHAGANATSIFDCDSYQATDTFGVENLKRVVRKDTTFYIGR
jgi:hypothetical protein